MRPRLEIQCAEAEYNGHTIHFRPLTLPDILVLVTAHEDLIKQVSREFREATASRDPDEKHLAQLKLLAQLAPLVLHALAISAGVPDHADAFAQLPAIVLAQFSETVWLLTSGNQTAENIVQLVQSLTAARTTH